MLILYFTATGNSLYVSKELGGELYSIPQAIKENKYNFSAEKIGIIFPVHDLGVPEYIEQFLEKVELNSDYIFSIITYGMFSGSAIAQLQRIAKRNNINFSYINEVKMVDNYIPGYDMEKQINTEAKKEISKQISRVKTEINSNSIYQPKSSLIFKSLYDAVKKKSENSFDQNFNVESTCTRCGICSRVCPINNIVIKEKPQFNGNCIGCLACTHNCPQNSIRVKKEKSKTRFRNQHISLKEIIQSNR